MKIEDNFLEKESFDNLQDLLLGDNFSWYYNSAVDYEDEVNNNFQFTHTFYKFNEPQSDHYDALRPILHKLDIFSLLRIKSNLLTKTPNIIKNAFHVDEVNMPVEKIKQWTTSIFYLNTNNGYTEFEDGTKVESVANRIVTFPADIKHRGTSCTDQKTRVLINFYYYIGRRRFKPDAIL